MRIKDDVIKDKKRSGLAAAHHTQTPAVKHYRFERDFSTQKLSHWLKQQAQTTQVFSGRTSPYTVTITTEKKTKTPKKKQHDFQQINIHIQVSNTDH